MGGGGSQRQTATPSLPAGVSQLANAVGPTVAGAFSAGNYPQFVQPSGIYDPSAATQWYGANIQAQPNYLDPATGLTYPQLLAMSSLENRITQGSTPSALEQPAIDYLQRSLTAPLGASPATTEAIRNWGNVERPTIESELARAGLGNSAAVGDVLGRSMSAFAAPLYAQEIANRQAAAGGLLGEGETLFQRPTAVGQMLSALSGTGLAQRGGAYERAFQVSQGFDEQARQDYLRRQALMESIANTVTGGILPSTIGQRTSGVSGGPGLFGWITGGQGLGGKGA